MPILCDINSKDFRWSGPPVCSQLVFCMHFCVWRCIPDISVERDVLHVHLLLRHFVLSPHMVVSILKLHFLTKWLLLILWNIWRESHKTLRGSCVYLYFIGLWAHWNWAFRIILFLHKTSLSANPTDWRNGSLRHRACFCNDDFTKKLLPMNHN